MGGCCAAEQQTRKKRLGANQTQSHAPYPAYCALTENKTETHFDKSDRGEMTEYNKSEYFAGS